ncbi:MULTISPECIES: hypothetical protein [unclassified Sphingomonas]|uniref:hypothetical protein n=1 Tax=unclassified Sphingomonas TaxID=196159 RepID=UPI00226A6EF8|nr:MULTISPECIES: hypothetical protein [unclassified Sphingomonas]
MFGDQRRGDIARNLLRVRAERRNSFPSELFDEHAWNLLLNLFAALTENRTVSESELMRRSSVSEGAGRRWIRHLIKDGQIEDRDDGKDVALTPVAVENMRTFLDRAQVIHGTPVAS